MDASMIELHETMIRLAKGIVTARERAPKFSRSPIVAVLAGSPIAGMIETPTGQLKASIGVWESWLNVEREKARST